LRPARVPGSGGVRSTTGAGPSTEPDGATRHLRPAARSAAPAVAGSVASSTTSAVAEERSATYAASAGSSGCDTVVAAPLRQRRDPWHAVRSAGRGDLPLALDQADPPWSALGDVANSCPPTAPRQAEEFVWGVRRFMSASPWRTNVWSSRCGARFPAYRQARCVRSTPHTPFRLPYVRSAHGLGWLRSSLRRWSGCCRSSSGSRSVGGRVAMRNATASTRTGSPQFW
jgi:hypothetical protein